MTQGSRQSPGSTWPSSNSRDDPDKSPYRWSLDGREGTSSCCLKDKRGTAGRSPERIDNRPRREEGVLAPACTSFGRRVVESHLAHTG